MGGGGGGRRMKGRGGGEDEREGGGRMKGKGRGRRMKGKGCWRKRGERRRVKEIIEEVKDFFLIWGGGEGCGRRVQNYTCI